MTEQIKSLIKTPLNLFKDYLLGASNSQKESWSKVGENAAFVPEQVDGWTDRAKELEHVALWLKEFLADSLKGKIPENGKVLDYGCGSGRYLQYLESNSKYDLVGMDFSEPTLKNFTSKAVQRTQLFPADLSKESPLIDKFKSAFDAIYSITVIQYVTPSKIGGLLSHLTKMLKPGGLLVLSFPIPTGPLDIFRYYHYVRYPPQYLESQLKRLGFEITFSGQTLTKKSISWFYRDTKTNHGYWITAKKN